MLHIDNNVTRRQSANVPLLQPAEPQKPQLDRLDIYQRFTSSFSPSEEGPYEEKRSIQQQLIKRDYELLEHTIFARDEAEIIRLLQIKHADLPRVLKSLLKREGEDKVGDLTSRYVCG